jgi:hypothetical protein
MLTAFHVNHLLERGEAGPGASDGPPFYTIARKRIGKGAGRD